MTLRANYARVDFTEAQLELLRRVLDEAATGYAESNPRVRLLRIVEAAQRDTWG